MDQRGPIGLFQRADVDLLKFVAVAAVFVAPFAGDDVAAAAAVLAAAAACVITDTGAAWIARDWAMLVKVP